MNWITVDAHQDMAYNMLFSGRDYTLSALETREKEGGLERKPPGGHSMLGWPDYQRGQVALIFGTLYLDPYDPAQPEKPSAPRDPRDARRLWRESVECYRRLAGDHPDMFRMVESRSALDQLMREWEQAPADPSADPARSHPTGLLMLMEGAEHIGQPEELEEWWLAGVRLLGPVWAGARFCGGMAYPERRFDAEGYRLLNVMQRLGLILDLSHMNEISTLQALDHYQGPIVATHANARAVLGKPDFERHFTDQTIRRLVERDGVIGTVPFSVFLRGDWEEGQDPGRTRLSHLIAHIDHICQLSGDALHVGLGTDFDGGFGWPDVPFELKTIADLPLLGQALLDKGYSNTDVTGIMGGNWRRKLMEALPA